MTTSTDHRRQAAKLIDRAALAIAKTMRHRLTLGELRDAWVLTGDLLGFAAWSSREKFAELPPLSPDDHPALRRLIRLRLELIGRTSRLLKRRARRRRRR